MAAWTWPPRLHYRLPGLVADLIEVEPLLAQALLGLADQREFAATLIDRNGELANNGSCELLDNLKLGKACLLHVALQGHELENSALGSGPGAKAVIGPNGNPLTLASLPAPNTKLG